MQKTSKEVNKFGNRNSMKSLNHMDDTQQLTHIGKKYLETRDTITQHHVDFHLEG